MHHILDISLDLLAEPLGDNYHGGIEASGVMCGVQREGQSPSPEAKASMTIGVGADNFD